LILDTNALSALADGHPGAVERISQAASLAIPAVVLGEFRYGIAHSRRRSDYESWLSHHDADYTVLAVDAATSEHYARIRAELRAKGSPIPANDVWIAASARQHRLPIVSRDRHFDAVPGVERIDW
jgi:tRNA(fMet)-specific endonuclease VapC